MIPRPPLRRSTILRTLVLLALVAVPSPVASASSGRVDDRNLPAGPLERVIVTWNHGHAPQGSARRVGQLKLAVPGIKQAATVSDDTAAYWLPAPASAAKALGTMHKLAAVDGVDEVAPDRRLQADLVPNDSFYAAQVSLHGTHSIEAEAAWDTTTGNGTTIAIVDTGITNNADEFPSSRILPGYDFISDARIANDGGGRDADPHDPGDWITSAESASGFFQGCPVEDSSWHGTHVTGIAAASGNNGKGVAGVTWSSKILPVRAIGKCGGYTSDVAAAIRWAAGGTVSGAPTNTHPADVINLSLSGPGPCDSATQSAIDAASAAGTTVVVAAGNDNSDASGFSPANCAGAIVVAATTSSGTRASFSNFGATVTIAAPGVNVASTYNDGTRSPGAVIYAGLSGTSMATPHVTGVVALAKSVDPDLTPTAIRDLLTSTAHAISCPAGCGAGLVDASAVVAAAVAGPSPTPAPTPAPTPDPSTLPDTTPPTVMTFTHGTTPSNAADVGFTLQFSEQVDGLTPVDFTLTGTAHDCSVAPLPMLGTTFSITVVGCTEGTVGLTLAAGAVHDLSSHDGPATSQAASGPVVVDRTGPVVSRPGTRLRSGVALSGSSLPVRVAWSASDPGGSGVDHYALYRTSNAGQTWTAIANGFSTTSRSTTVPSTGTAAFAVGGTDKAGNDGGVSVGSGFKPRLIQQTSGAVSYGGTWKTTSSSSYSGGSAKYATKAGAFAKLRFTGTAVGFVTRVGPGRGKVKVYLGSTRVATLDLHAASTTYRYVAWQRTWSSRGTHTLKLVVVGTSGRPRIELDAIEAFE